MRLSAILFCLLQSYAMAQAPLTVFESSNGTSTADYRTVIGFYQQLAATYPEISIQEIGMTDSGYPLHLVTLDTQQQFDFKKAHADGRTIILINNGIHPGEPDGIEASMMLMRNYAQTDELQARLGGAVVAVIPVYNIGGALNRNSFTRVNQDGPLEYGFRGNARNYDLNRDFIKADTKNTKAFYEIFQLVNPDIFVDTHVSNGADYQYSITHLMTQHNKMGGALGQYIETSFTPTLEKRMADKNTDITPYVNVFNTTPDESGFSQFLDNPRYSTGYATLFNSLGLMIETHMLKSFKTRVESTYTLLQVVLDMANTDGSKIKELRKQRIQDIQPGLRHSIDWRLTKSENDTLHFKGYRGQKIKSEVTDQERLAYDSNWPFTKEIPYYNTYVPSTEITIPEAYVIPQAWHKVIERLTLNGVKFDTVKQDTVLRAEVYYIERYTPAKTVYEGHYPNNSVITRSDEEEVNLRAGDLIIPVMQEGGRYIVETLEPAGSDSFFTWNFFDTILQQKEGFSPYVFEDLALQLLEAEPELRKAFNKKKKEEPDFALNWYAQLDYIYKNSPYYEQAHMRYPIYRIK